MLIDVNGNETNPYSSDPAERAEQMADLVAKMTIGMNNVVAENEEYKRMNDLLHSRQRRLVVACRTVTGANRAEDLAAAVTNLKGVLRSL